MSDEKSDEIKTFKDADGKDVKMTDADYKDVSNRRVDD